MICGCDNFFYFSVLVDNRVNIVELYELFKCWIFISEELIFLSMEVWVCFGNFIWIVDWRF